MRTSIIAIVALLPTLAFAQQGTPRKTDTPPPTDKTLPLKGAARSNSCAEFGPGFVKRVGDVARIPFGKAGMHDWPQIHERYGPLVWKTVYRILRDHTEALDCF